MTQLFSLDFSVARFATVGFISFTAISFRASLFDLPVFFLLPVPFLVIATANFLASDNSNYDLATTPLCRMYLLNYAICVCVYQYARRSFDFAIRTLLLQCLITGFGAIWMVLIGVNTSYARVRAGRVSMLELDENGLATNAAFSAIGCLIIVLSKNWPIPARIAAAISTPFLLQTLLGTGSRGGLLSLIAGIIALIVFLPASKRWSRLKWAIIPIGIYFFVSELLESDVLLKRIENLFRKSDLTQFSGRERILSASLQLIGEKPLLGWGESSMLRKLGYLATGGGMIGTHNSYIHVTLMAGIPSGMGVIFFWLYPLANGFYRRWLREFPTASIFLVFWSFVFLTLDQVQSKNFWIVLGLLYSVVSYVQRRKTVNKLATVLPLSGYRTQPNNGVSSRDNLKTSEIL